MARQVMDRLIIDGELFWMNFCPPLPESHQGIYAPGPEEQKDDADAVLRSTACWRGYHATWEVRDGHLYLIDLRGRYRLRDKTSLLADWFKGTLEVPKGKTFMARRALSHSPGNRSRWRLKKGLSHRHGSSSITNK